jgi:hypothetical protein
MLHFRDMECGMIRDKRRAKRSEVSIGLSLRERQGRPMLATLTSLSQFGCQIVGASLKPEQMVWVRLPGLEPQQALSTWANSGEAGLSFFHPLHPAVVRCLSQLDGYRPSEENEDEDEADNGRQPVRQGSRREQILSGQLAATERAHKIPRFPKLWVRAVG